ncbi:Sec-independent protein translocase protein TatB [Eionea flava]
MGLFEILLIAVVTLLVVGPERMPEAVRSTALTIGRVKRMLSQAKEDIEKQVGADDIRQQLHNEAVMDAIARSEAYGQDEFDASLTASASQSTAKHTPAKNSEPEENSILNKGQ